MRTLFLLFVPVAAFTSMACGGTVDPTSGGTGSSGVGGSSGSTSAATSSGTSTGAGGDAATSSSSAAGSTSGAGGSSACSGYIDVTESGGAPQHFASICMGTWGSSETMTAVGYHFAGGPAPGTDKIEIVGCAGTGSNAAGLHLSTPMVNAPGTFLDGSADYTDKNGVIYSTAFDPYQVVITKLDAPGGVIEGTFTGSVTGPTDAKKSLTATFHVCRVADENTP